MLKKAIIFSFSLLIPFLFSGARAQAEMAKPQIPTQEMEITSKSLDPRAQILHNYLAQYNSPLADHASDFVEAADTYNVDWKLVPAISGVESTFGKQIPGGYNGWGWGVYGDQAIYFKSWRDGIFTVTEGISQNYTSKGVTDPYAINRTYAASPAWGAHVSYFLADINKYAQSYSKQNNLRVGLDYYLSTDKALKASTQALNPDTQLAVLNTNSILNP